MLKSLKFYFRTTFNWLIDPTIVWKRLQKISNKTFQTLEWFQKYKNHKSHYLIPTLFIWNDSIAENFISTSVLMNEQNHLDNVSIVSVVFAFAQQFFLRCFLFTFLIWKLCEHILLTVSVLSETDALF